MKKLKLVIFIGIFNFYYCEGMVLDSTNSNIKNKFKLVYALSYSSFADSKTVFWNPYVGINTSLIVKKNLFLIYGLSISKRKISKYPTKADNIKSGWWVINKTQYYIEMPLELKYIVFNDSKNNFNIGSSIGINSSLFLIGRELRNSIILVDRIYTMIGKRDYILGQIDIVAPIDFNLFLGLSIGYKKSEVGFKFFKGLINHNLYDFRNSKNINKYYNFGLIYFSHEI
jgi:hypothetical protein